MNIPINKNKLSSINSLILILFAFTLPLSVAVSNIIMVFIVIFWLIIGDFKNDWENLKNNYFVKVILLFICLHFIGLFWTEDLQWGFHIIKKEMKFLLVPIFMLFVKKEYIKYYILAFLCAIVINEIFSYLIWFDFIEPFKNGSISNPTSFISHLSYSSFLVIALYIIIYSILFEDNLDKIKRYIYLFFVMTTSINIFITGGRAGQVMYFVMIIILFFQYYSKNIFKSIILSILTISIIFTIAYSTSEIFKDRVNLLYNEVIDYQNKKNTSVGLRITFTLNSLEIIKDNLLFGVGTGDFKKEYKKINEKNTSDLISTTNPHNMYILILVQFGLLGIVIFLSIFYIQITKALKSQNDFVRKFGVALPILFLIIMFSDSYLLGHFTTMLFVFFSAILYKDYNNETI